MYCDVINLKIVEILIILHDVYLMHKLLYIFIKVFDHNDFDLSYFILLENLH